MQAWTSNPQETNKIHVSKPCKSHQKPQNMSCVGNVHPVNLDPDSQPLNYIGSEGLRIDDKGMVLPHSILGSLEDFRSYLEAKGDIELVNRIPKTQRDLPSEAPGKHHSEAVENGHGFPSGHRNIQSNALQHWHTHMRQRRRQQDFLSDLLDRPVQNLLMNQANRFREFQEQRELLNQIMPLIHSGYGHRVGSEFWSLPQRYGDEMSGISATLTRTQQGKREPVTHVGQPSSIRQESGIICAETLHPASRTLDQSVYLQHQCREIGEALQDMVTKKLNMDGLEVIGSGKPFTFVTVRGTPLLEKEEEQKDHEGERKENLDSPAQYDGARSDVLPIPALRFGGQLARWTGNPANNQGEVGICTTIIFEALTGESASSHLELHNEGSTSIFYSWQQLPLPHSFPNLQSQTMNPHFYFNSSSGVLLPGDSLRVEFIFKSETPGIKTELWQLNTHPMLLQGGSMQAILRGIALYQDKTADQRLFIEKKLEKAVMVKMCRSIVYEVLRGVHSPERPSSPAEVYITEEQTFQRQNSKLRYFHQSVEELKRLWQEVNPGYTWDLSVDSLRQVVLSLPEQESAQDTVTKEKGLAHFNSLLLQLSGPSELQHPYLTAADFGQQLLKKLLDTMSGEATRLRNLLGLPERETWVDKKDQESLILDADLTDIINMDEKSEKHGRTAAKEDTREEIKMKGKRRDEVGKHIKEKEQQGNEPASLTDTHPESISLQPLDVGLEVMNSYTRLLHKKVYALMEDLVDTLCDLMDEGDQQDGHTINTRCAQTP